MSRIQERRDLPFQTKPDSLLHTNKGLPATNEMPKMRRTLSFFKNSRLNSEKYQMDRGAGYSLTAVTAYF